MTRSLPNCAPALWTGLYGRFDNTICRKCCGDVHTASSHIGDPEPMPYIGPDFFDDEYRLMFVGIETYGNWPPKDDCTKPEYSIFETERIRRYFFGKPYNHFWNWINKISVGILEKNPEEVFNRIAYSNLHKCQVRKKPTKKAFNKPSYELAEESFRNCIEENGWIYREIKKIKARNIIVFAGYQNQYWLAKLFLKDRKGKLLKTFNYDEYHDLTPEQRKKWHNGDLLVHLTHGTRRFIVTNHPNYTSKHIPEKIINIIKGKEQGEPEDWKMPTIGHQKPTRT